MRQITRIAIWILLATATWGCRRCGCCHVPCVMEVTDVPVVMDQVVIRERPPKDDPKYLTSAFADIGSVPGAVRSGAKVVKGSDLKFDPTDRIKLTAAISLSLPSLDPERICIEKSGVAAYCVDGRGGLHKIEATEVVGDGGVRLVVTSLTNGSADETRREANAIASETAARLREAAPK